MNPMIVVVKKMDMAIVIVIAIAVERCAIVS